MNFEDSTRYCCCPLHSYASKGVKKLHTSGMQHDERMQRGPRIGRKKNVLKETKLS